METFEEYLSRVEIPQQRIRLEEIFRWISEKFPNLVEKIAWNQPMFTDHGTFIIGFSIAKHHMAVAPERAGIIRFSDEIVKSGYTHTNELIRFPWDKPVDFGLLEKMIAYNIQDKVNCSNFWRK